MDIFDPDFRAIDWANWMILNGADEIQQHRACIATWELQLPFESSKNSKKAIKRKMSQAKDKIINKIKLLN